MNACGFNPRGRESVDGLKKPSSNTNDVFCIAFELGFGFFIYVYIFECRMKLNNWSVTYTILFKT